MILMINQMERKATFKNEFHEVKINCPLDGSMMNNNF